MRTRKNSYKCETTTIRPQLLLPSATSQAKITYKLTIYTATTLQGYNYMYAAIPDFHIVRDWGDFSSALFSDVSRDEPNERRRGSCEEGRVIFSDVSTRCDYQIWIRVGASPKSNNNNNNKILLCKKEKHKRNRRRLSLSNISVSAVETVKSVNSLAASYQRKVRPPLETILRIYFNLRGLCACAPRDGIFCAQMSNICKGNKRRLHAGG